MGMRTRTISLIFALTLSVAACGAVAGPATGGDTRALPATSVAPVSPGFDPIDAALPGQPPDEMAFKPVPPPVQPPAPKPRRSPPTPPPDRRVPSTPPTDAAPVDAAVADLALRMDIPSVNIAVLDARAVTWRDGSVGCPADGLAYTQAEVPGFLVVLEVDDASYRYHAAGSTAPFLCATPQSPLEGSA